MVSRKWTCLRVSGPALGVLWSVGERVVHMVFTRHAVAGDWTSPMVGHGGGGG